MPEEYLQQLMPWVSNYYDGQLFYHNGEETLMLPVVVTAEKLDPMYLNLLQSIRLRKEKDAIDRYRIHRDMGKAQDAAAKALLPIVAAPALAGLPLSSIGTGTARGLLFIGKAMTPSSYTGIFGTGAYNTALGGSNASLGGALADAGVAGYYGQQAYKAVKKNPNVGTVTNALLSTFPMIAIPKGYSFVRQLQLRTKDGVRTVNQIRNNETGKFIILEDINRANTTKSNVHPTVDLKNYHGEKLTGNEPGFDEWALSRVPETDHFPDLSHGLTDTRELLPIITREFESLPNGSRIDLGKIFSGDIGSNLLQYVRRHKDRIKMVLPRSLDETVRSNDHGIRGPESANIFNSQLLKLLESYDLPHDIVPEATYDASTNTLIQPKLSFIKLHKKGNKIKN